MPHKKRATKVHFLRNPRENRLKAFIVRTPDNRTLSGRSNGCGFVGDYGQSVSRVVGHFVRCDRLKKVKSRFVAELKHDLLQFVVDICTITYFKHRI